MATTKRKSKKSSIVEAEPQGKYKLTVYMQDRVYNCQTDDLKQAILSLRPPKITNKVRIIVEEGKKKAERIMYVFPARRLFNMPLSAEFFAKNIILRLK